MEGQGGPLGGLTARGSPSGAASSLLARAPLSVAALRPSPSAAEASSGLQRGARELPGRRLLPGLAARLQRGGSWAAPTCLDPHRSLALPAAALSLVPRTVLQVRRLGRPARPEGDPAAGPSPLAGLLRGEGLPRRCRCGSRGKPARLPGWRRPAWPGDPEGLRRPRPAPSPSRRRRRGFLSGRAGSRLLGRGGAFVPGWRAERAESRRWSFAAAGGRSRYLRGARGSLGAGREGPLAAFGGSGRAGDSGGRPPPALPLTASFVPGRLRRCRPGRLLVVASGPPSQKSWPELWREGPGWVSRLYFGAPKFAEVGLARKQPRGPGVSGQAGWGRRGGGEALCDGLRPAAAVPLWLAELPPPPCQGWSGSESSWMDLILTSPHGKSTGPPLI